MRLSGVSMDRARVIQLYKTLLFMGREYPKGYEYFRERCHRAFLKNKDVTDPKEIEKLLKHGEYVIKELEALYMLKKYRTLRKRYSNDYEFERMVERLQNIEKKSKN